MRPWQAWTVTICVVVMCIIQVIIFGNIWYAGNQLEKAMGSTGGGSTAFDQKMRDIDERLDRETKALESKFQLPKPPPGRVIVNPPQR